MTPTAWGLRCLDMIKDGRVHHREEIIQAMMTLVPAEKAFRKGERHRMYKHKNTDGSFPDPQDVPRPEGRGDAVKTGKRMIVNSTLHNMKTSGIIDLTDEKIWLLRFPIYYKPEEAQ